MAKKAGSTIPPYQRTPGSGRDLFSGGRFLSRPSSTPGAAPPPVTTPPSPQSLGLRMNPHDYSGLPKGWTEPLNQFNTRANPQPISQVPTNTLGQWQGWQSAQANALRGR